MNRITYGAITLLIPEGNPGDLSNETFTINLSGSKSSENNHRKKRAEIVSGIVYPEIIGLGYEDISQLLLFPETPSYPLQSFKREGEIRVVCRGLRSGKPYLASTNSLDDMVTGSEIFGEDDFRYMLFGSRHKQWLSDLLDTKIMGQRYIEFLDVLNKKLKGKLKEDSKDAKMYIKEYINIIGRMDWFYREMWSKSCRAPFGYKQRIINMYRKLFQEDPLILKHIPYWK